MRDRDTAASRLIDDLFRNYGTGAAIDIATKAIADARDAGFAEAIEMAAKKNDSLMKTAQTERTIHGLNSYAEAMRDSTAAIRALAPATTEDP